LRSDSSGPSGGSLDDVDPNIKEPADFRFFEYKLPNKRSVFLSNRPDWCKGEQVRDFMSDKSNDGDPIRVRFLFTDDYAEVDPEKHWGDNIPTHWYCWVPGLEPAIETIWTALSLMSRYDKLPYHNSIWMHCDFSSMRAPTFFGLYLNAAYPDKVKEICDPLRKMEEEQGHRMFGRPDEYAETEMRRHATSRMLIQRWREGGEKQAHAFMVTELQNMNRDKR
jgi:hypothetical protein